MTKSVSKGSTLGGIHDLLRRLDDIETKCLGKSAGQEETLDSKDKFLALKANMNHDLSDMKALIYERKDILKTCGSSHEVIHLTSQIRVLELKLKENLIQLKEIYRKQCDGTVFVFTGGAKPTPEDLAARYEAMDKIAFQMEEARKAFRTGQGIDGDYEQEKLRKQLMNNPLNENGGRRQSFTEGEGSSIMERRFRDGELDEEEKDAMNRWSERERKLDEELAHVSIAVDRLKPLAEEITAAGQKQTKLIAMVDERVDKTSATLRGLNVRLRKFIDTNRRSTFMFRIVLILVLLGLGAYIYVKYKDVKRAA